MTAAGQSSVTQLSHRDWTCTSPPANAVAVLESGDVLFFPDLAFEIDGHELRLFETDLIAAAKNVSFDPRRGCLSGTTLTGADANALQTMVARFSGAASAFVRQLLPGYGDRLQVARASFRPVEIAGRASSWRKD